MTGSSPDIWEAFTHLDILEDTPDGPLPECNRGSWFCPVADERDAHCLDEILQQEDITRIYDFGAGDCRFAVAMDHRGYEVIAYEALRNIAEYGLARLPENDVELIQADYYSQWPAIKDDRAAFVALGQLNELPSEPPKGLAFDDIAIPDLWTYENYVKA